jgi:hypothetical protein
MSSDDLDDNDELLFVDEDYQDDSYEEEEFIGYWDILIVDDDHEIHSVTKLALSGLNFTIVIRVKKPWRSWPKMTILP